MKRGFRGWPLLVLLCVVVLVTTARGSTGGAGSDGTRRVPPSELTASILAGLEQLPTPEQAMEQRFTVRAVPTIDVPLGPYRLQLAAKLPDVGNGAVGVELIDAHGGHRRLQVSVTRHLRALLPHAAVGLEAGTILEAAHVVLDTTWVERKHEWKRARAVAENPSGWTVHRALSAGDLLCRGDLQRTPDVRRGATVDWIVSRAGLKVSVRVQSRGEGFVGDWVHVQSPFDRRLKRVQVIGPNRVGNPAGDPRHAADAQPSKES